MTLTRRRFLAIAGMSCIAKPTAARSNWNGRAFGADASIHLEGADATHAVRAARDTIRRMEQLFSLYRSDSALSQLNRFGRLDMPPEFALLMAKVAELNQVTEGLFDPTIQPVWSVLASGGDPAEAHWLVGWYNVDLRPGHISFKKRGMALTLNGIAQGFATDRVKAVLRSYGFENVIVNVGEYAVGAGEKRFGIQNLNGALIRSVSLTDEAIATSSSAALVLSGRAHHILHPNNFAMKPTWNTVSVIANEAASADALSTAFSLTHDTALARKTVSSGLAREVIFEHHDGEVITV